MGQTVAVSFLSIVTVTSLLLLPSLSLSLPMLLSLTLNYDCVPKGCHLTIRILLMSAIAFKKGSGFLNQVQVDEIKK
jgi:hypothetical protein